MKKIICLFIFLLNLLFSQDTLITVSGAKNIGKYLENKNNTIIFQNENSSFPQTVPHKVVSKVVLLNGEIIFDLKRDNVSVASSILLDVNNSSDNIIGNKNSKIFHSSKSMHLPTKDNREIFENKIDAQKSGYRICSACFDTRLAITNYQLEKQISRESNAAYRYRNEIIYEYENQEFINSILEKVLNSWPETLKGYDYRILVVKDATINATAIAGGNIYLTTGLLNVVESVKELEYVIAHEVAHIEKRHSVKTVKNLQRAAVLTSIVTVGAAVLSNNSSNQADVTSLAYIISNYAANLAISGYSRELEEEADIFAQIYMNQNGDDLDGGIAILGKMVGFAKIRDFNDVNNAFASHPRLSERIKQLSDSEIVNLEKPIQIEISEKIKKSNKKIIQIITPILHFSQSSSKSNALNVTFVGELKNLSDDQDYELDNIKLIHPNYYKRGLYPTFKNIKGTVLQNSEIVDFAGTVEILDEDRDQIINDFKNGIFEIESSINRVELNKGEELKKNIFQFVSTTSSFQRLSN